MTITANQTGILSNLISVLLAAANILAVSLVVITVCGGRMGA